MFVDCLTSQQHASLAQGRICSDNFTCCHTEIQVADQTVHLTQSQYTDTGPTSPSTDPITPSAWQGSHWSANFEVTGMTRPRKNSRRKRDSNNRFLWLFLVDNRFLWLFLVDNRFLWLFLVDNRFLWLFLVDNRFLWLFLVDNRFLLLVDD